MSQPTQPDELAVRLRSMQTILGAIIGGAVVFLLIAVVLRSRSEQAVPDPPTISYIALGIALVIAFGYFFATDRIATAQRRKIAQGVADPPRAWYAAYGTTLLVGAVLAEAAAFVLIVAYLLEGDWRKNWVTLAAAIGFIAFLVTIFPTRSAVEAWIKEQQAKLQAERGGR